MRANPRFDASLTLNLAKSEFGKATVTCLGKLVEHGQVRPVDAEVAAVLSFPVPTSRRKCRWFLGRAGYYHCFCKNFSVVVAPLTRLCSPAVPFVWDCECEHAFNVPSLSSVVLLCWPCQTSHCHSS